MASPPLPKTTIEQATFDRIESYRQFDARRQQDIEFLTQEWLRLRADVAQLHGDLEDERAIRRQWKDRALLGEATTKRKFVAVLVDGDGYIFKKAFLEAVTASGGSMAANQLYTEVQRHLASSGLLDGVGPDCDVVVNVYAHKAGLARTLVSADFLDHVNQIDQFFCSFSQSRSLFNFTDCGYGKERADAKIRGVSHIIAT